MIRFIILARRLVAPEEQGRLFQEMELLAQVGNFSSGILLSAFTPDPIVVLKLCYDFAVSALYVLFVPFRINNLRVINRSVVFDSHRPLHKSR